MQRKGIIMQTECYVVIAGALMSAFMTLLILVVEVYGATKYHPDDIWCNPISKFFNEALLLTHHRVDSIWCYTDRSGHFTLGARGSIVPCVLPLLISMVVSISMLNGYLTELLISSLILVFVYLIRRMRTYLRRYCKWTY